MSGAWPFARRLHPPPYQRQQTVMGVVYLVFNEGYAATSKPGLNRPDLCTEAIRLVSLLVELTPPTRCSTQNAKQSGKREDSLWVRIVEIGEGDNSLASCSE